MDVPNAPNPTNSNMQDQFVDAVQGLAVQPQGPAVQGLAAQGPANNNTPVGQNVPVQPPQQLDPALPVPTGLVVPAHQVVYQNWVGKKPKFSGIT